MTTYSSSIKRKRENTMSETKELNLEQKVTVKSIAGWNVGFPKLTETGDALIAPGGSARFTRNEIITQVQNGNKLFVGTDGMGSHATLYIEDADTRKELEFDTEEYVQDVFSDAKLKKIFALRSYDSFVEKFEDAIVTRAEMYAAISAIKKLKLNEYDKIQFVKEYTGYKNIV